MPLHNRTLVCLAALAGLAASAAAEPVIFSSAGKARLELSSGQEVALPLPDGAELSAAAEGGGGFWAAGTKTAPGGREIVLWAGDGGKAVSLPAPPGRKLTLRAEPTPLVAEGGLAALVWLEGKDRQSLGVRVAAWNGTGWERSRLVAPPGPGSQLALAAAPLGDGTWLLAWSAFDGEDDEIVWSRGRLDSPGSWSPARPVTRNHVPDITPALTALPGGGAALAWCTFDGDGYRTVLARFAKDRFGPTAPVGGLGALYPTFDGDGREVEVIVRTSIPRGWEVWRLDAAAHAVEKVEVAAESVEENARPALRRSGAGTGAGGTMVTLRWPGSEKVRELAWEKVGDVRDIKDVKDRGEGEP